MSVFFLHHFFHNETNDRLEKGLVKIPRDPSDWPEAWKRVEYKQYRLLKPIPLSNTLNVGGFSEVLLKRRSSAEYFVRNASVARTESMLSSVLQCGYGLQGCQAGEHREENRMVPSAGQRYPLEMYVFLFKPIEALRTGIYHYGVREHVLEPVVLRDFSSEAINAIASREFLHNSTGMICMTGFFGRTVDKYGSRGYRYVLLEAGHVAQNMLLAGTEKGINMIPIAGINEEEIEKMIGLANLDERVVYTLFF